MLQHLKQEVIQAIENILQKYRDRGQECSQEHQKDFHIKCSPPYLARVSVASWELLLLMLILYLEDRQR